MEFTEEQPRLEWPDPIVKDTGMFWIPGTDIVGKSFKEVASKTLAVDNLRDIGVDEGTVEDFATEQDPTIIFNWIKDNLEHLYTIKWA